MDQIRQQHRSSSATLLDEASRRKLKRLEELKKALKRHRLVIIVGAGISLHATATDTGPLKRVTWKGLIKNGLDYLVTELRVKPEELEPAYQDLQQSQTSSLLNVAGIMRSLLEKHGHFATWLDSVFHGLPDEIRNQAISLRLKELNERGAMLLTTNYDDIIERFCNLRRITASNETDVSNFKFRGEGVLHIHGSYLEPAGIVLDARDYYHYNKSTENTEIRDMLKTFLDYNTLLFVGCGTGLEDPNFKPLLDWAKERHKNLANRHCLLAQNGEELDYKPLVSISYGDNYNDLVGYLDTLLDCPPIDVSHRRMETMRPPEHARKITESLEDGEHARLLLTNQGFDPNASNFDVNTALLWAAEFANGMTTEFLLRLGADCSIVGPDGRTALHFAVLNRNIDVIPPLLLECDIHTADNASLVPLVYAAKQENVDATQLLLDAEENFLRLHFATFPKASGKTVLQKAKSTLGKAIYHAVKKSNLTVLGLLIKHSKELCQIPAGSTVYEPSLGNSSTSLQDVDISDSLVVAAFNDQAAIVELLLKHGADVNATDKNDWTALHAAIEVSMSMTKMLLMYNPDLTKENNRRHTPLHKAFVTGNDSPSADNNSIIHLLLEHSNPEGSTLATQDKGSTTPMFSIYRE